MMTAAMAKLLQLQQERVCFAPTFRCSGTKRTTHLRSPIPTITRSMKEAQAAVAAVEQELREEALGQTLGQTRFRVVPQQYHKVSDVQEQEGD